MYIKITNGVPENYSIGMLRRDNPSTSFPKHPSQGILASFGVYPCVVSSISNYDSLVHTVEDDGYHLIGGQWTLVQTAVERPVEEASENIRNKRNSLLKASDWTQVADAPVSSLAWASYRQALRDVTKQSGFPFQVVWPDEPD